MEIKFWREMLGRKILDEKLKFPKFVIIIGHLFLKDFLTDFLKVLSHFSYKYFQNRQEMYFL